MTFWTLPKGTRNDTFQHKPCKTIHEQRWHNSKQLPLAGDLKLLNLYLIKTVSEPG